MKIIPFSSALELQRQSYRTIRSAAFAESAVWAVCALSGLIGIFLSLGQLTPRTPQPRVVTTHTPVNTPVCESVTLFQTS
jgi:hypothetical protein